MNRINRRTRRLLLVLFAWLMIAAVVGAQVYAVREALLARAVFAQVSRPAYQSNHNMMVHLYVLTVTKEDGKTPDYIELFDLERACHEAASVIFRADTGRRVACYAMPKGLYRS